MRRGTSLARGLTVMVACAACLVIGVMLWPPAITVINDARRWAAVGEMRELVDPAGEIVSDRVGWDRGMTGACFGDFEYRVRLSRPAEEVLRRLEAQAEAEAVQVEPDGDAHVVRIYRFVSQSRVDMGCD